MKKIPPAPILPRGRIANWTREQLEKLNKDELKALLANAERLLETEVAALCRDVLAAHRRTHYAAARALRAAAK
jgi:hypothetical protein